MYAGVHVKYVGVHVKYVGVLVKYPLFLPDFNTTLIFSTHLRQILKWQLPRKSVQWEPGCSVTDGDGHDEANNRFSKIRERG
jgi:hypothetical protein